MIMETERGVIRVPMKYVSEVIQRYSRKASEYIHQLGIAGIVIIWALYTLSVDGTDMTYKALLVIALLLFIAGITCSLCHYYTLALKAEKYYHEKEREILAKDIDKSISSIDDLHKKKVPKNWQIEKQSWKYFKAKFWAVISGYMLILFYVLINLFNQLIQRICS